MSKKKKVKKGEAYRPFWQGATWVLSFPAQLARALELKEGDKIIVNLDEDGNLIVESYTDKPHNGYTTTARAIGGAKLRGGLYLQLGFTIPAPISPKVRRRYFKPPIIEEKRGNYFRIVYKVMKKEEKKEKKEEEIRAVPS